MSDTTIGYPPGVAGGVAAYVREVRAELADLPTEEIDDLTGGMEADLSELATESGGDLIGRLGSPALYAAELRAAAGLPERVPGSVHRRPLTEAVSAARASFTMFTEQRPWLQSVMDFLVTLRPAWWLLRGFLAAWVIGGVLGTSHGIRPQGLAGYVLAMVAIVVSVQLGGGWLQQWALSRPLIVIGNAAAILVALVVWFSGAGSYNETRAGSPPPPGVSLDGGQVSNIYAYDSDGKRITGVRLFAEDGRPLNGAQSSVDANGSPVGLDLNGNPMAVVRDSSGAPLLNVFPQMLFGPDPWQVTDPANPDANLPPWTPPMSINPLIPSGIATAKPTPLPTTPTTPATPAPPMTTPAPTAKPRQPQADSPQPSKSSQFSTPSSVPSPLVTRSGG